MPGTFVIDTSNTLAVAIFMSSAPKLRFGTKTGEQETSSTGLPKWVAEVAVTFHTLNGMKAVSEVISIGMEGPQDPTGGTQPGTPVVIDGFRVGMSDPKLGQDKNGRPKVDGGKPWYQAGSIRPAQAPARSKGEAA